MIEQGLINPGEPLGRGLNGSGVAQMREPQTRPGPIHRVLDQEEKGTGYFSEGAWKGCSLCIEMRAYILF